MKFTLSLMIVACLPVASAQSGLLGQIVLQNMDKKQAERKQADDLNKMLAMVAASRKPMDRTERLLDGRGWKTTAEGYKLFYIQGFLDAYNLSVDTAGTKADSNCKLCPLPSAMQPGDIVDALNRIYADPANVSIPAAGAIILAARRFAGETVEDNEREIARWRAVYSKLP